jgi:integrase
LGQGQHPRAEGHTGAAPGQLPRSPAQEACEINAWLVEKWRAARLKTGAKPVTVNRDLDDLRSVLAKAVAWGLLETHPLVGVKRLRTDANATVRFLDDDEERRLRAALGAREERIRAERDRANAWRAERGYRLLPDLRRVVFADHLKPLVLLSINTGLRRGELFGLTWRHVDLERAILTVAGTTAKSGATRHIPLNDEARAVLEAWRDQATNLEGLVFPGRDGGRLDNVRKGWLGVLADAKISRFRWHDQRHHFASRLVMVGVDLNTVRELLGHSTYAMTLRYAHLAPEHKAAAVAKLGRAR